MRQLTNIIGYLGVTHPRCAVAFVGGAIIRVLAKDFEFCEFLAWPSNIFLSVVVGKTLYDAYKEIISSTGGCSMKREIREYLLPIPGSSKTDSMHDEVKNSGPQMGS